MWVGFGTRLKRDNTVTPADDAILLKSGEKLSHILWGIYSVGGTESSEHEQKTSSPLGLRV